MSIGFMTQERPETGIGITHGEVLVFTNYAPEHTSLNNG